jgi:FtsH-binding integral membrane protein
MTTQTLTYRNAVELNSAMANVYKYMMYAVLVSMVGAYWISTLSMVMAFLFTGVTKWVIIFAPLAAIFGITYYLNNSNPSKEIATALLLGFALLMGLSLSTVFAAFTGTSIFTAFLSAAILFGVMSFYGYFTKQSLESWGKFLFVGVIAVIISSIVNLFLGNSVFQMVISACAVMIFTALTAYDTQRLREMLAVDQNSTAIEVMGALTLYLNFVNIFTSLLQLFGAREE